MVSSEDLHIFGTIWEVFHMKGRINHHQTMVIQPRKPTDPSFTRAILHFLQLRSPENPAYSGFKWIVTWIAESQNHTYITYVFIFFCVYIYTYIYTYMCIYIYTYVDTHIHIYIHIHTRIIYIDILWASASILVWPHRFAPGPRPAVARTRSDELRPVRSSFRRRSDAVNSDRGPHRSTGREPWWFEVFLKGILSNQPQKTWWYSYGDFKWFKDIFKCS